MVSVCVCVCVCVCVFNQLGFFFFFFLTVLDLQKNWADGTENSHIPSPRHTVAPIMIVSKCGIFATIREPTLFIKAHA